MSIAACMGGWCAKRDHCHHYHAGSEAQRPAERLCPPKQDGAVLSGFPVPGFLMVPVRQVQEQVAA